MNRVLKLMTIGSMIMTIFVIARVSLGAHIYRYEALTWLVLLLLWQGAYLGSRL